MATAFTALLIPASTLAVPADYTFPIIVEAHCATAATPCGSASEADFEQAARQSIYDMNVYWRNTGISFQFKSVSFSYGDNYLTVKDDALGAGQTAQLALLNTLRTQASNDPANIYWFVIEGLNVCFSGIPGSHLGRTPDSRMPKEYYGVFCGGVNGMVMAHEIGHAFCLPHPFTWADSTAAASADHDGDGLADTADDPGIVEGSSTGDTTAIKNGSDVVFGATWCGQDPETCAVTINDNREWCAWDEWPTDAGSFRPTLCTPRCRKSSNGTVSATGYYPDMELTMSYYMGDCSGPFVFGFQTYEGFSPDEVEEMRGCYVNGTERGQLTDVCKNKGGDTDWDGLCDDDDPCPKLRASIWDLDKDKDGISDACDPCPDIPAVNSDNDGDGIDDACDPNDDNDACNDDVDDHPFDAMVQVGTTTTPGCSQSSHPIRASESGDADKDGIPDCRDDDNDDDGVIDGLDACPNSAEDMCVIPGQSCGMQLPWDTCMGGGCGIDIMAKLKSLMNPDDPRLERRFEVRFKDDSMYLLPETGYTAGEIRGALTGKAFGMLEAGERINMSLVKKSDDSLIVEVGAYRIGDVRIAGGALGNSVEVGFGGVKNLAARSGSKTRAAEELIVLDVGLTWGVGIPASEVLEDTDSDGVPDSVDNCVDVPNVAQTDTDNDHIGNACDPDFDDDGVVTQGDISRISDCEGVAINNIQPFPEPGQPVGLEDLATLHHKAIMCRFADLNGDGTIDGTDLSIADGMLGKRPGPSAFIDPFMVIDPNPDQSPEMANDTVGPTDVITTDTGTTGGSGGCSAAGGAGDTGRSDWLPTAIILALLFGAATLATFRKSTAR